MLSRRHLLQALPVLPSALGTPLTVAQPISGKPVTLLVAASAGATVDASARFAAEPLSKILGVPVVVENRPGAGGALGSAAVAKAAPDGHTLLFTGVIHFSARYSGEGASYDPVKDFKAVARLCSAALAVVVPTNSPYKTLADLIAAMKARPGEIDYSSGGVGSTSHLSTVILNDLTGTRANHVPYKGNTPAVTDTVGGVVAFTCQGSGGVLPLIKAGRLRALAVTSEKRSTLAPELPTLAESGLPGYSSVTWFGVYLPAGAPPALVEKVHKAFAKAVQAPEVAESLAKLGVEPAAPRTPAQFAAMVQADSNRWAAVIRQHKITLE